MTYDQLNQLANRLASHWITIGLVDTKRPARTVCVMIENSPMFIITWLALAKVGITAALINTSLKGKQLKHSISISEVPTTEQEKIVTGADTDSASSPAATSSLSSSKQVVILSEAYRSAWEATVPLYEADGEQVPQVLFTQGANVDFIAALYPDTVDANVTSSNPSSSPSPSPISAYIESAFTTPACIADSTRDYAAYRRHVHWESPLFLIYTSGTTGPSKAAIFSQRRFLGAGVTWAYPMELTSNDKYYIVLPLYHGNGGVVAVSACMHVGCTMVIRTKFSTSNFWADVRQHQCTAMVYVGELWRYLHTASPSALDSSHSLRVIAGNGLRPDIWEAVIRRFGIKKVVEHYGMTEMPAGPYMNFYGRVSACGYIPPDIRAVQGADKLVQFDVDSSTVRRDAETGHCFEVTQPNEIGECVFLLAPGLTGTQKHNPHTEGGSVDAVTGFIDPLGNSLYKPYRNYTNLAACERRVYRHCFEPKDAWFATGDLLKRDADGFFYFVDRIGDTFRWKGENVATNDVGESLCSAPNGMIKEANVYGVEWAGQDGRAGMASIVSKEETFDLKLLLAHLYDSLPSFAIPAFLRIRRVGSENNKTSTLKFQKVQYQREGFHPQQVDGDQLYWWPGSKLGKQQQKEEFEKGNARQYIPITMEVYEEIIGGGAK